ncbi:MAG: DNA topoisomerase IV subunit A [bacterium]|nr:DNA topoisomerase IV subunit A [bacterium]
MSGPQGDLFDGPEDGDGAPQAWQEDGRLRRLIDDNFVRYASYVIRDRAIPDLADGLKPVQRRILHSLKENDDGKFIKVANIVGHTMQYHPHGDASITEALVGLANKGYLIEGQGNFGNLFTGDPAAAARYIECRLTELARRELFNDELTKFVPSYDGRKQEPVALPAKLPLMLMQGAEGIAVGLSTRVLPHNFVELLRAQIAILEKKPFDVVPDFRQGGLMDAAEYDRGRGRVRLRAKIELGKDNMVLVRSVPYGTTTDSVIASIETAARKKKLAIKSIDDFTAEQVEIQVALKPGKNPDKTIQALYAFTQCEVALSARIVVIHKNRPVEMTVDEVLRHNTRALVKTLRRELEAERRKKIDEIHAKTLVRIFIENRIYKRIEECTSYADVQKAVLDGVNGFRILLKRDVTLKDVEMLLGIKIKRISRYDMDRNRKEIADLEDGVEKIEHDLAHLTDYCVRYIRSLLRKYGADHPRRTELTSFEAIEVRDLTSNELTLCYDSEKGYLGHTISGEEMLQCSSLDKILHVRADGVYKVTPPPDKLFVDRDMQFCGVIDRERVFVVIYRDEDGLHHLKRFAFGGTILNREYRCAPPRSTIVFLSESDPRVIYVRYKNAGGQAFDLADVAPRNVKTRGKLMTSKTIESIHASRPRGWSDKRFGRPRSLLDL